MSRGQPMMMMEILDFGILSKLLEFQRETVSSIIYLHIFEQSHSQQPVSWRHWIRNTEGSASIAHHAFLSSAICILEDYKSAAYRATGTN